MNFRHAFKFSFFHKNTDNAGISGTRTPNNNYDELTMARQADGDTMDNTGDKKVYLKSFNKIVLKDDNNLVINNKYSITRQNLGGCYLYTISNLNEYWKEDISFSQTFDKAELEKVIDDDQYQIRYFHFSLWTQERYSGRLVLRFGYEDTTHENSQHLYDFFNVVAPKETVQAHTTEHGAE